VNRTLLCSVVALTPTVTSPCVAPVGTVVVISDADTTVNVAGVPLKLTLVASVRFVPRIFTVLPTDPAGALVSIGKALAFAEPLSAADPNDREALRALASAQQSRSEVLFGNSKTQDAIASMQAAARSFDRLVAGRDATPALICEAAAAYGTLGDELGQSGTASFADKRASCSFTH
jgi:hypothetical protein